jgi:hypothetical protein
MRGSAVAFTFCVALGSMAALAGCGSSSPAPAPSTVTVPSPVPVQLSGVATDDDGARVSGVTVFVHPFADPSNDNVVTTVTDGSGRYSITYNSLLTPGGDLPVLVQTEKSGYESYKQRAIGMAQLALDPSSETCCSLAATANVPANGELRVYPEILWSASGRTFTLTSAILP